ncbi:hypothetical protein DFH29DRAFT_878500 [Suillus ampliporus]|nr:hypothetical protein DFH29DRAFT_878500 [Suillus ampliporus]
MARPAFRAVIDWRYGFLVCGNRVVMPLAIAGAMGCPIAFVGGSTFRAIIDWRHGFSVCGNRGVMPLAIAGAAGCPIVFPGRVPSPSYPLMDMALPGPTPFRCACTREFTQESAYTKHQRSCMRGKKQQKIFSAL